MELRGFGADRRLHSEKLDRRRLNSVVLIVSLVIGSMIVAFAALIFYVVHASNEAHARFMNQCMQDHKEYECTATWRAGNNAIPTFIIIPAGK